MRAPFCVAAAMAAVLGMSFGTPALAKGGASQSPKLQFFNCVSDGAVYGPCNSTQPGTVGWVKGDAPSDSDHFALAVTTAVNDYWDSPTSISYAGANVLNTPIVGQTLAQVSAVSFDTSGFSGGGAPRLGLSLSNGDQVYLDPATCETSLGNGWYHADFRMSAYDGNGGAAPACTINTYFPGYSPDNAWPAFSNALVDGFYGTAWNWMNAASAARGAPTITAAFLVQDWGPGTSVNDNLTFDNVVFTNPPNTKK